MRETTRARRVTTVVLLLIPCVLAVTLTFKSARAQQPTMMPSSYGPYKIATLPDGTVVYKMMDQGCELFIAENLHSQISRSDSVSVSITTGRGCK